MSEHLGSKVSSPGGGMTLTREVARREGAAHVGLILGEAVHSLERGGTDSLSVSTK